MVKGVSGVEIGGAQANQRNVIIDNDQNGIHVTGRRSTDTKIDNNIVGFSSDNFGTTVAHRNHLHGILIDGESSNTTIGTSAKSPNFISGNTLDGIRISGSKANTVGFNWIGVGFDALLADYVALPNGKNGITVEGNSQGTHIGGTGEKWTRVGVALPLDGNVISGNGNAGIEIDLAGSKGIVGIPSRTANLR